MMKNENNRASLHFIWEVSGKYKMNIVFLLLIQGLLGISGVWYAMLLRNIIDEAVCKNRDGFVHFVVLLVILMLVQISLRAINRFLDEYTKSSLENRFKEQLFSYLLYKDYASVTALHSGEWMNRLTSDTVVVANGMAQILPNVVGMLVKLAGAAAAIFVLESWLGYLLLIGGALVLLLTYGFRKVLKRLHKQVQEADGVFRVYVQEHLNNLLIVRAFARERQTEEEAEQKMEAHRRARLQRSYFSNLCNLGFGTAMQGAYLFGAVFCGYGIFTGTISYGTLMAILQLIAQIQSPFANLTGFLPRYYAMLASAERLMEAQTFVDEHSEPIQSVKAVKKCYREELNAIGLKQVSFTYRSLAQENKEACDRMPIVCENINLEIKKGEYVAFTGPSGCGKSTILKLFMSLYPVDEGERYLSVGQKNIPLTAAWRNLFAYVPQGNQLMSGTIREIIAFSDKEQMQDEMRLMKALQISCADQFVIQLEQGLDTELGERGLGLSEGQMQRIAIARAIFSERPILLLDESTSALDEETEQQVLYNLRTMTDKTVVIVTHRPAVLAICDKNLLMSEGIIQVELREKRKIV